MKTESVGDGNKAKRTIMKYIKIHALEQFQLFMTQQRHCVT